MSRKCHVHMLDKLQKCMCEAVGPSLAASLEPLADRRNIASISLFYRNFFGRCSSELAEMVPLPHCMIFYFSVPRCKDVNVNSFVPGVVWLWNFLPAECFHSTYDRNGFTSRFSRHLLYFCSFWTGFFNVFYLFYVFLVTPCHLATV